MKIAHYTDIPGKRMDAPGVRDVSMRILIGPEDGAPNFVMRLFTVEPGGHTPLHRHDWEHEIFIKTGEATLVTDTGERPVDSGNAIFIAGQELHQLKNRGSGILEFICLVPKGVG